MSNLRVVSSLMKMLTAHSRQNSWEKEEKFNGFSYSWFFFHVSRLPINDWTWEQIFLADINWKSITHDCDMAGSSHIECECVGKTVIYCWLP